MTPPYFALQCAEVRKRRSEAKLVRVGVVDAGDKRLGQPIERFLPESPANERSDGLVGTAQAWPDHEIQPNPRFAEWRQKRGAHERFELGRRNQGDAVRQINPAAVLENGNRARHLVDGDQAVCHSELIRQLFRPWFLSEE